MEEKIYKYIFRNGHMFRLKFRYNERTKAYTNLVLYSQFYQEINVYFLEVYAKYKGNLLGRIELDNDIERDITKWIGGV